MPFSSSAESNAKLLAKAGNDGKRLSRARSSGNLAYIERWYSLHCLPGCKFFVTITLANGFYKVQFCTKAQFC